MDCNVRRKSVSGVLTAALWLIATVFGSLTPSRAVAGHRGDFAEVVAEHLRRYPGLEIQDLYKLAFQAAMGAEHAVPSREAARAWLEREIAGLVMTSAEPLSDPLSPDGELVRINLRPFIDVGGDADMLLDAFVQTATDFEGSSSRLEEYWSTIESMAASGRLPFGREDLQRFRVEMKERGWPALHHSATYDRLYHPAYRVVLRRLVEIDGSTAVIGRNPGD